MAKKTDGLQECKLDGCTERFKPVAPGTSREKKFCCSGHAAKWHTLKTKTTYPTLPGEMRTCALPGCETQFRARVGLDGRDMKFYCSRAHKEKADERQASAERSADGPLSTEDLLAEVHKRGYYALKADASEQEKRYDLDLNLFDGDTFRLAVLGDTHYCSKQQQRTHLHHFYHYAHEVEGITDFFHTGDLFNGDGRQHKGQEFENFVHGEDEQLEYVKVDYPKIPGCKTRVIGGSHDYSFFKSSGSDIIKRLAKERDDIEYLGYAGAYIDLTPNVDIYLCHPDGGTAYAVSYQPQKKIENFTPENKPNIVFFGHYHRALYMEHRNVATLLTACFQAQTPFLKAKAIFPVIGAWIVDVTVNEDGVQRFRSELFRYYVPVENDF